VWKDNAPADVAAIKSVVGVDQPLAVSPSAPLYHLPVDLAMETDVPASSPGFLAGVAKSAAIPEDVAGRLRFARQKLLDLVEVAQRAKTNTLPTLTGQPSLFSIDDASGEEPAEQLLTRSSPYVERRALQLPELNGVLFPTSTIGSFPQTADMRKIRLAFRKGEVSEEVYYAAVDKYIEDCVDWQESCGLDVLVHGEPERSDMVEFFAEKMDGFFFTRNAWVQSYGSRYVRPPVIYATVRRTNNQAMTVREFRVA